MKTTRLLIFALALLMAACGGETKKQAAERASDVKITSYGVGPLNFGYGATDAELEGYTVSQDENGMTVVTAEDGEVVMTKMWETITVTGYEFKTEEGIHVGMPVAEAVKLLGNDLRAYGGQDSWFVCRHFGGPDVVAEDDNISFIVGLDAIKHESRDKVKADPSSVTAEDFTPEIEIETIIITELL